MKFGDCLGKSRVNDKNVVVLLKCMMMIMVVLYHSCIVYTGEGWTGFYPIKSSYALGNFARWLNSFHIYCLTFASGYFFYFSRNKRKEKKIAHRAKKIMVPYLIFSFAWVLPIAYFVLNQKVDLNSIFVDIILARNPRQLWYLVMIFECYLLFELLFNYNRKNEF